MQGSSFAKKASRVLILGLMAAVGTGSAKAENHATFLHRERCGQWIPPSADGLQAPLLSDLTTTIGAPVAHDPAHSGAEGAADWQEEAIRIDYRDMYSMECNFKKCELILPGAPEVISFAAGCSNDALFVTAPDTVGFRVPEPASLSILGGAAIGLMLRRPRKGERA